MPDDEEFIEEVRSDRDPCVPVRRPCLRDHDARGGACAPGRESAEVLYASTFVGDFQAFAHLRVEEVGLEGIGSSRT